jgi:hypothetical protein
MVVKKIRFGQNATIAAVQNLDRRQFADRLGRPGEAARGRQPLCAAARCRGQHRKGRGGGAQHHLSRPE